LAAAAILDFFQSASGLVRPSLGDVGQFQKLLQLQNLDMQAAEIVSKLRRTNVIEVNH